jgi:predicted RNase H-like HicB family nuclease
MVYCALLDVPVTTQGRTLTAAKKNLREAVELYIETWGYNARLR